MRPTIEMVPARAGVKIGQATEMLILVRISAPQAEASMERPALNVGLVLDRSGSMSGSKLQAARQAAAYGVSQLLPTDRVSVTIYDSSVETIVPSTLATDKAKILASIGRVQAGGATALHAGWVEGATQVSKYLQPRGLNRVLLLTDGLANEGETDQGRICEQVSGLAQRGVSTTTLGLGTDFNEDLLQAMSEAGDGNTHFIESAGDLERIFAREFRELMATFGQSVSLGIEPQGGVEVQDVLNDLPLNLHGRLLMPNLLAGGAIEVVLLLQIPPQEARSGERDVCFFRLAWDAPGGEGEAGRERQVMREVLSLPALSAAEWEALPEVPEVKRQAVSQRTSRLRQQASEHLDRGDGLAAQAVLAGAMDFMACEFEVSDAASAAALESERAELSELQGRVDQGDLRAASKIAKDKNYRARRGR